jgi:hypothetical protein
MELAVVIDTQEPRRTKPLLRLEMPEQLVDEPGALARLPAYGVADPDHQVHESTLQLLLSHPASVHQHEVTPHLYFSR